MSKRIEAFRGFKLHVIIGACFRPLSAKDEKACENFILENDHLSRDDFAHKVNRWFLDIPAVERPATKKMTAMWALVSQANGAVK